MVEIEIGVLRSQCLDRRIGERKRLVSEIKAWEKKRNDSGARVEWMFTDRARTAEIGARLSGRRQRVKTSVTRY